MQISVQVDAAIGQSLQQQVFESIRRQILTGRLKASLLMPSTRLLSEQLGVSRNTIILAYDRLIAEGYLYARKAVGTYVNPNLPEDSLMLLRDSGKAASGQTQVLGNPPPNRHPLAFAGQVQALFNRHQDKLDIDLIKAAKNKIDANEQKYPVGKSKGNAKKYTEHY